MTPRIRKAAAVASSVALLGAAGIGVANAADTSSTTGTTSTNAKGPGHDRRGGGPGVRADELAKVAKTLGVTTAKLEAAADAARPAKGDRPKGGGDDRAAALAKALGVDTAKVQAILEADRPTPPKSGDRPAAPKAGDQPPAPKAGEQPPAGGRGHRGGPGGGPGKDDTKLVAALAKGLGVDEAKVKTALADLAAAHDQDHQAKDAERYAAIAKSLGLDAKDVQAAFEAARPAKPTK